MNKKDFDKLPLGTVLYNGSISRLRVKISSDNVMVMCSYGNAYAETYFNKSICFCWKVAPQWIQELYKQSWVKE